jgi:hypothetical protein
VTLVILLIAFGALVAAGLPVLLAFSGVLATLGLSSLASHIVAAGDPTQSVILLIGMAVGVDYSLFYLRREREERRRGASPRDALLNTARTSGHAAELHRPAEVARDREDVRPDPGRVPGRADAGEGRDRGRRREGTRGSGGDP